MYLGSFFLGSPVHSVTTSQAVFTPGNTWDHRLQSRPLTRRLDLREARWSDNYPWTDDEVLEWVSIYWFSRAGPAVSLRMYYELTDGGTYDTSKGTKWVDIGPAWRGVLRGGPNRYPISWSNSMDKVGFEAAHSKSGHFAAHLAAEYARRRLLKDV
ncbi:hypothetical protein C8Q76DRAFT_319500 [Earliella scabrosa]|nr:hypothetical protein C8Q76DRAFT_319500 [Earliella scabrosa]